jgi:hypothetical protein
MLRKHEFELADEYESEARMIVVNFRELKYKDFMDVPGWRTPSCISFHSWRLILAPFLIADTFPKWNPRRTDHNTPLRQRVQGAICQSSQRTCLSTIVYILAGSVNERHRVPKPERQ